MDRLTDRVNVLEDLVTIHGVFDGILDDLHHLWFAMADTTMHVKLHQLTLGLVKLSPDAQTNEELFLDVIRKYENGEWDKQKTLKALLGGEEGSTSPD